LIADVPHAIHIALEVARIHRWPSVPESRGALSVSQ
jgi:hypothetical protein